MAVGTHHGYVQVWDVAVNKQVNKMQGHSARVGALAWNGDVLSSGSRDRLILQRDVRTPSVVVERRLVGHRQEVRRKLLIGSFCYSRTIPVTTVGIKVYFNIYCIHFTARCVFECL